MGSLITGVEVAEAINQLYSVGPPKMNEISPQFLKTWCFVRLCWLTLKHSLDTGGVFYWRAQPTWKGLPQDF